jgi:hypothetical protein
VRHGAFDTLTPEAAYWLGFLFADGSVCTSRARVPSITLGLSACDREHVEQFRAFVGSGHAITDVPPYRLATGYVGQPKCVLTFGSAQLAQRVLALGRYSGPIDGELAASRHFWRGVVDGDGSIGIYLYGSPNGDGMRRRYAAFSVAGQQPLLDAFNRFLAANDLPCRKVSPRKSARVCTMTATGRPAERIVHLLYRDAPAVLRRKAVKAQEIIALDGLKRPLVA